MPSTSYLEHIKTIRKNNDTFFKHSEESPLTTEQKQLFKGLVNFPIDEKLNLHVKLHKNDYPEEVIILATKGDERTYLRFGYIEFMFEGKDNRLTVFKPPDDQYLFVPFKDKTSGVESYSGGRYVELEPLSDDIFKIDFNLAYLPYCVFNDNYSCTLVPSENFLEVRIPAGQRNYPH
ncbi:MAG: DUF1684 domain-containing protein [Candidatus Hodarchaeales archaeon]|jgi:uncharacterized protein (DUF1684 family)